MTTRQAELDECVECKKKKASSADFYHRHGHCDEHTRREAGCAECRATRRRSSRQPRCKDCDKLRGKRNRRIAKMRRTLEGHDIPREAIVPADSSGRFARVVGFAALTPHPKVVAALKQIAVDGGITLDWQPFSPVKEVEPLVLYDRPPRKERDQYAQLLDLTAAAGLFGGVCDAAVEGYLHTGARTTSEEFLVRVDGHSMEPEIPSGSVCLFKVDALGAHLTGRIVLAQSRGAFDPEDAGRFTVKRLRVAPRRRDCIAFVLEPRNPAFERMAVRRGDDVRVVASYLRTVRLPA
jgi:SOS-response transcriptional repressor LexA